MTINIKTFPEIVEDMIARMRGSTDRVTDYNVGSVVRSLLEAPALEIDEFYQSMYYGLLEAIPTAVYRGFGFDLLPAVAAGGLVEFVVDPVQGSDIVIPAGTRLVSYNGTEYRTTEELTIPAGSSSGMVRVAATVAGEAGNIEAGALSLADNIAGITATNPQALTGGSGQETEEQRAARFAAFVRSLARGTLASLEYAATIPQITDPVTGVVTERVDRVSVFEQPGHVYLFIHNNNAGTSQQLVDAVQRVIDGYRDPETLNWIGGYRPAGMWVEVQAMVEQPVDVSIEVKLRAGFSQSGAATAIRAAVERTVRSVMPLGQLRPIAIINAALGVAGVDAVTVVEPSSSIDLGNNVILYLRDLDIAWTA